MPIVHIPDLPWEEQHSPARKFHSFCRNVSLTLGGIRNTGTWGLRSPRKFFRSPETDYWDGEE